MPTFFSVSLLTIVVVAGIAAVGWMRSRPQQSEDASNKKKDKEILPENRIEIVVDNEKENLTKGSTRSDNAGTQTSPTISSIRTSITNKIALELVNRRQYVKAVCDRFESWSSGDQQSDFDDSAAIRPVSIQDQDVVPPGTATTAFRTKPKPNNLSSFVRQCVSNIERSAIAAGALPARTISPRNSFGSNQCESPPKGSVVDERRLPSLVTATDCDPMCEDVDDERDLPAETVTKRVLRRVPSGSATPIAFARPFVANTVPSLAPFAAIAMKTLPINSLPPVWSRVSKPDTTSQVEPVASKSDACDPEETESPVNHEPVIEEEEDEFQAPVMPPPPRKVSNNASRLLQFQQLVPSNQARTSFTAN